EVPEWACYYPDDTRRCNREGDLQLHHLHYDTLGHETLDDVQLLCDRCHRIETVLAFTCPTCGWRKAFSCEGTAIAWLERVEQEFPPDCSVREMLDSACEPCPSCERFIAECEKDD